jgi:hypothetical protein
LQVAVFEAVRIGANGDWRMPEGLMNAGKFIVAAKIRMYTVHGASGVGFRPNP